MSRDEILEKIQEIFRDVFDDEQLEIDEQTNREDFGEWDSLTHISIVMELMQVFNVKFTMDEASAMNSVEKMIVAIVERGL